MSTDDQRPSEREAIEATAAAWLTEADAGLAPERAAEFARWRAADARHEAAVARLERAWGALQELRDFRPEAQRHPDFDLLGGTARSRRSRRMAWAGLALAASLALVAGWLAGTRELPPGEQRHATTLDGYQRLSLPDGSIVELNSATEIGVQFQPTERRVQLRRGEAHFTVAKNPQRPFTVEVDGVAVRAVGTAFNVRRGAGDVEVLVTEGTVEVARPTAVTEAPATLTANHRAVVQIAASAGQTRIVELGPESVREALAWQGPRLHFSDTPLREAIAQFNRRNAVQLELADAELGALPIAGSFRAENLDAFVRLLTADGEIVVAARDERRIVLRRVP